MTGLRGDAAIVGYVEYPSVRHYEGDGLLDIEQWSDLSALALADAGLTSAAVDGLVCSFVRESNMFAPATIAEYLGWKVSFAERVDLGGAFSGGAVWRAAAAIELGLCNVVVVAVPSLPRPANPAPPSAGLVYGSTSVEFGSPQAEFEVPYGNVAQNCGYAMIAQRYAARFGYDPEALAKLVVDQRRSAAVNEDAVFFGKPVTVDDVLSSRMIAEPLRMLEIVMPTTGGAAVVVASREVAKDCQHRPAFVVGCGEHLTHKTPTYAEEMTDTPVEVAAATAFAMAGCGPSDMDALELYDCYSITALLSIEGAGACEKGDGMAFVRDHDLSYSGDFPCNTHGGQLGVGQAGQAGGMSHVTEAVRQLQGRAGTRQLARCDAVFVSGTGGVMSEQTALVLAGD
jgi:acetyl-CoA C-acetyltransferase